MGLVYLLSVWLHILAATTWLGGMIFLILVVVPTLRGVEPTVGARVVRDSGRRFRTVGWVCFGLLVITGSYNLWWRGVRLANLFDADWIASWFGRVLWLKLLVFSLVLALSAFHDFVLGPRASAARLAAPDAPTAEHLRRAARAFGRVTAVLALVLFALAVMLVRGPAW